MSPVDERRYAALMAPTLAKWRARAENTRTTERVKLYAQRRADTLSRPYAARLTKCARAGIITKCGCRGKRDVRWYGCRQHLLCGRCRRQRSRRLMEKVRGALTAASAASPPGSKLVLLTLTVRHSGNVAADRAAISRGWRKLYKALHRRGWGKFPYVGVWEVTPGDDGKGHIHAHVAVIWPYRDWSVVREMWLRACPESERIHFAASRRDGRPSNPASVTNYLGKYLAKGAQTSDFSPQLRADVLHASYQSRWTFSSVGFWIPWVPCCPGCGLPWVVARFRWHGEPFRPVEAESERGNQQLAWPFATSHERAGPGCS